MAKNFKTIYEDGSDSSALEQKFYLKEEVVRGQFIAPTAADFIFSLPGGQIDFSQPLFSSPHRSGRHHLNAIREKFETSWTIPTYFNIDEALGAAAAAEIDPSMRLLHKSMIGAEDNAAGAEFTPDTPSVTMTILDNRDKYSIQSVGGFVEQAAMSFPGDGQAQTEWSGSSKIAYHIGIGLSTTANIANTITLQAGEGKRFIAGGQVMLVETGGLIRSADTPDGSPRLITLVAGDVITVDGAVLADADGSAADVYLCYYEPEGPDVAIDNPVTGLVGTVTVAGFSGFGCFRAVNLTMTNNHELQNNCYGEQGLGGSLFIPGGRFTLELEIEVNMNSTGIEFINQIRSDITGEDIQIILGDSAGRHLEIDMDRVIFNVPGVPVPESGSVPVTFTSAAVVSSAIDAKDEISVHYK